MTDHLSPDELAAATRKRRAAAQAAVLAKLGVPFEFSGRSVKVARVIAEAHALLPQTRPVGGVDFSRVR
jgi:hypothetical protein